MRWGTVVGAIGLISAIVGLYQAFQFNHLREVSCNYSRPDARQSNVAECVDALTSEVGEVVMLQLSLYADRDGENYGRPFEHSIYDSEEYNDTEFDDVVVWNFNAVTFSTEVSGDPSRLAPESEIEAKFPGYDNLRGTLEAFPSGIVVEVRRELQRTNPYSRIELNREYSQSVLEGPFQISTRQSDMALVLTLSPAPMTDDLRQQVRCAEEDWPAWLKFLGCPFL